VHRDDAHQGAGTYLTLEDDVLIEQCEVDVYRASGPGGQKRNKTCSAVRLRHTPTGLVSHAVEDRSQHGNKRRALRRLREAIALHVRRRVDLTSYSRSERLDSYVNERGQLRVNSRNRDFPSVVAEVLDVLTAAESRVSDAAAALELSTGHLVQFIKSDVSVRRQVNELRRLHGEKPLR